MIKIAQSNSDTGVLAIEQAAKGCISGKLKEWPILLKELLLYGIPVTGEEFADEVKKICITLLKKINDNQNEICICAAVKDNTGYIWRGHRHSDCIFLINQQQRHFKNTDQGFVTSKNRFVTREEGYQLQIAADIPSASGGYRGERLYSEDLY
jgi:hypothetical protein